MEERRDDDATAPRQPRPESASEASELAADTEPLAARGGPEAEPSLPVRFEPRGVIGTGGMGRVLRVLDRSLNREVAVKLLLDHRLGDARSRVRFLREARAAGTLRHPNIVTVHDVAPDGTYLVMEFVAGESLARKLRRDGKLPVDEVRRVGTALLGALTAAHREGIIHRDIKPANVLLDELGTVKLTDFGIASFGDSELTSTGQMIGTPAYMAPEQLRGRRVDARADVYGVGATLFETATGSRLNSADGQVQDPRKAVLDATGDAALAAAIARAVSDKEADRFPDATAFAAALASRASARRWWPLALAGLAAAGTVTIAVAVGLAWHRGPSEVASTPHVQTVAMLPFANHVGDPRLDFAASGLPHLLGEQLARAGELRVLGYYRLRGQVTDPEVPAAWAAAARELGADVVIRGELAPHDGRVRVSIVIERSDGTNLDRIVREIAIDRVPETVQALAPLVARAALGSASALPPIATREFDLDRELELGVAAFEHEDFDTARAHLEAVIARDASVVDADYYLALLDWWQGRSPAAHLDRALAGALTATRRDFLVGLRMLVGMDYPRGVDYFRELARRAPDERDVQYGLFEALFHGGHPGEAMAAYRRLRELAPSFYVGADHAMLYYLARGDAAGIRWTREHWDLPASERLAWEVRALMADRRYPDAVRALERAAEEQPGAGSSSQRDLVAAYAVTGQLALAREVSARLAADPGYRALADYGLAIAGGEDGRGWRVRAQQAAANGIPGFKPWEGGLELAALDLAAGAPQLLREDLEGGTTTGRNVVTEIGRLIVAGALHDVERVADAHDSPFPQEVAVADALAAEERHDAVAAATAWRTTVELDADGRWRIFGSYALARNLAAVGDHAGVIAACDEVISPRVFGWAWASTVGPCLRWSADAATALGHRDDARWRWQRLLALRSAAPADDELVRAARAALGAP